MHSDCDSIQENDNDNLRSPLLFTSHDSSNECLKTAGARLENLDPRRTFYTIVSTTLCVFSFGLIGLSFLLPWSRSHLTLKNTHFPNNLSMPLYNDATLQEIFSALNSFHHRIILFILGLTTIFAPILWCSFQAKCISFLYKPDSIKDSPCFRKFPRFVDVYFISRLIPYAQSLTKFSMLIVYVNMLLQGCTSQICFTFGGNFDPNSSHRVNSDILAQPEIITADGMMVYIIGVTCGVFSFINLQVHLRDRCSDSFENDTQDRTEPSVSSPPAVAFKHCHLQMPNHFENVDNNVEQPSTSSNDETCQLPCDRRDDITVHSHEESIERRSRMTKSLERSKVHSFETGLLSILLFVPAITGPLLKIHHRGILTPLIKDDRLIPFPYSFVNIISLLTKNTHREFFSILGLVLFWFNVVLVPGIVWMSSTIAWGFCIIRREQFAKGPITFATTLLPLANLSVFTMAIFIFYSSISIISNYIFDQNQLCLMSKEVSMESKSSPCLTLSASFEPMMFVLVLQVWCTNRFLASMKTS